MAPVSAASLPGGFFSPAPVAGGVALPAVQAPDTHPATEIVTGWLSDLPEQERRARVAEAERRWMIIWPIVQGRQRGEKWGRAAIDGARQGPRHYCGHDLPLARIIF